MKLIIASASASRGSFGQDKNSGLNHAINKAANADGRSAITSVFILITMIFMWVTNGAPRS